MKKAQIGEMMNWIIPLHAFSNSIQSNCSYIIPREQFELCGIPNLFDEICKLELPQSQKSAERLMKYYREIKPYHGPKPPELGDAPAIMISVATSGGFKHASSELIQRLRDELQSIYFFSIENRFKKHVESAEDIFGTTFANFPSAKFDAEEALKCLSFGRTTACVMHLMRVLEFGLKSLARRLQLESDHSNWHNLIERILSVVKTISADTHGADWKKLKQFAAESATQFMLFKDAWRNNVMHIHVHYNDTQASAILESVKSFMQHLSTSGLTEKDGQ